MEKEQRIGNSRRPEQAVTHIEPRSPAKRAGLRAGDRILLVNGEPVLDLVDYEALTAEKRLEIRYLRDGEERTASIVKDEYTPLGLGFETTLMDRMQTCRNKCVFCFIDQMPKGIRSSLNVKDDDWRMSFIMGNYVSLTNVDEAEFNRILRRRVSPLYISVHTVDGPLRSRMMHNKDAGKIMERLQALKEAGITFHCQAVLCPGLNDGAYFAETVRTLSALRPQCASLAAVPVGLTKYREGLYPLRSYTEEEAAAVIEQTRALEKETGGEPFVFLSDEWYLMAGQPLPAAEAYGDFAQIENGVGLLRLFEAELKEAIEDRAPLQEPREFTVAGGTAATPFFRDLYRCLLPYNIVIRCVPVENRFFGGNVHVAGLVTGSDLLYAFSGGAPETVLIPGNMLRERDTVMLDGMELEEVQTRLGARLIPFANAYEFTDIVFSESER